MGKIKRPSIFRHKDGKMLNKEEEEAAELRFALLEVIDEIEASGVEIDETEVAERIAEIYRRFDEEVPSAVAEAICKNFERINKEINNTPHTCTQCGAPLKDGKCEYCGTIYN